MTNPTDRPAANRWMLLLIASIALIPFLLAWFYATHPELIHRRSNYGSLIIPARPLGYRDLLGDPALAAANLQETKGRWVLLQMLSSRDRCGPVCRQTLYATRQIRLMLNKDVSRVRRLLLSDGAPAALAADLRDDPDLLVGTAGPTVIETLTRALGRPLEEGMVIVIDPFANAMMWYPPGFDPYGVLRDLKHLLRTSQIG